MVYLVNNCIGRVLKVCILNCFKIYYDVNLFLEDLYVLGGW